MKLISIDTGRVWTMSGRWIFRWSFSFVLLFILTLSFPHPLIPDLPALIAPVFEKLAYLTGHHLFDIQRPFVSKIISDSTGLYIHIFNLSVLSLLIAYVWSRTDRKALSYNRLFYWFRVIVAYYLALYMLIYGFNKLFKWQFYIPEPNTLYTTLGNSYRDILYWSTMGTSHSYNVFLGMSELIAAFLLFFKRTRLTGAIFSAILLLNIIMINFSFNINVKLFSLFLLGLAIILIVPEWPRLFRFLILRREKPGAIPWEPVYGKKSTRLFYFILKSLVLGWLLASSLFTYIKTGNLNDDKAARPAFHGAWDVSNFARNGDTLPPLLTDSYRWKRVFIHRRGYLIIQGMNDEMQDYLFSTNTIFHLWLIQKEGTGVSALIHYDSVNDSLIHLNALLGADSLQMDLKRINLDKLPLMQKEFNWTVD